MVDIRETQGPLRRVLERLAVFNQRHPWSHNDHFHGWILRHLPARRERALDVGCGRGGLVELLASRFAHVDGIDVDAHMVDIARRREERCGNVTIRQADFASVAGRYDAIIMVAVLHHLDLEPALRHGVDILAPGGRLLVVGLARQRTRTDLAWDILSALLNPVVGVIKHPRAQEPVPPPFPVAAPTRSFDEIAAVARHLLPGVRMRRRLFFRFTLEWTKPGPRG